MNLEKELKNKSKNYFLITLFITCGLMLIIKTNIFEKINNNITSR